MSEDLNQPKSYHRPEMKANPIANKPNKDRLTICASKGWRTSHILTSIERHGHQNGSTIESSRCSMTIAAFLAMARSPSALSVRLILACNQIRALETFPDKLSAGLTFVDNDAESAGFIGVKYLSTYSFASNSTIFASFLGRRPNTIRLTFREHGVPAVSHLPWGLSSGLPDSRNWRIHVSSSPLTRSNPRETFRYQKRNRSNRRFNHGTREGTKEADGE
jgi:hypothetical protein